MARKITPEENYFVCSFIQEGTKEGLGDEQIQERRKWLSEKLELSLPTIAAITAHLKIRAQKLLADIPTELIDDARARVDGIGGAARSEMQTNLANDWGIDRILVEAMTDGVMPDHGRETGSSGEHADYDNETKRKWRKEWAQFIDENTDKKNRARMRVLCLPGKNCLEIPLYVQLGFDPKNIVGVEGGDRVARAEFELNAPKLGIDHRVGDLEDILSTEAPFDVVSLDFHGFMGKKNFEICQRIPLADKAVVMTNFLARREKGFSKDILAHQMTRFNEVMVERGLDREVEKRQHSLLKDFVNGVVTSISPLMYMLGIKEPKTVSANNLELDEARNQLCPGLYNIGMLANNKMKTFGARAEALVDKLFFEQSDGQFDMAESGKFAVGQVLKEEYRSMCLEITVALCELGKIERPKTPSDASRLDPFFHIFCDTFLETPYLKKVKKTSYKSDTSSSPLYITDMAVVETPSDIYGEVRGTVGFLFRCMERMLKEQARDDVIDLPEMNMAIFVSNFRNRGFPRSKGQHMPKEDSVILRRGDEILEHFPLKRFMKDVRKYAQAIDRRYDQDAWSTMFDAERSVIQ